MIEGNEAEAEIGGTTVISTTTGIHQNDIREDDIIVMMTAVAVSVVIAIASRRPCHHQNHLPENGDIIIQRRSTTARIK